MLVAQVRLASGASAMPAPASPREVLARLLHGISDQRWLDLHELYAENAVVEYPFALPAPTRLQGRDAIQRYFAAVARTPLRLRAHHVVMHQSSGDPAVIIAEYDYDGLVTTTGRSFQVSNIQVSTTRDADIRPSRLSQPPGAGRNDWPAARGARCAHNRAAAPDERRSGVVVDGQLIGQRHRLAGE